MPKNPISRPRPRSFIVYRVLCRLNEQAAEANRFGRDRDARDICELIGRLEYQHFSCAGFETALTRGQ